MGTPILLGAPRPAPRFAPLFVAIDKGFLADEGLEATLQYSFEENPTPADFWAGGVSYKTYLGGTEIRMICGFSTRESSHVLMVRPEVESPQQLEQVLLSGGMGAQRAVSSRSCGRSWPRMG